MRLCMVSFFACLAGLGFMEQGWTQGITDQETMIHKNVKLAEMAVSTDIPADIASQYRKVLPVFRKVLTQNTRDQPDAKRMLIRVAAGVREIGSAKTKRPLAKVTASCRNSTREYIGNMILYSYLTSGPVSEAEIEEFLRKQILNPMECYVPVARVFGSPEVEEEVVPSVAEVEPAAAETTARAQAPALAEASPAKPEKSGARMEIHRAEPKSVSTGRAAELPKAKLRPGSAASSDRRVDIHQNVRLIELTAPNDIPAEIMDDYRAFLPMFREVLEKNTRDQPEEKQMTIRVQAGVKEIGSAKTVRVLANVTASCRNSTRQYIGNLILHSYLTDGPVNEEETEQFLRKQILEPSECYVPTEGVYSATEADR